MVHASRDRSPHESLQYCSTGWRYGVRCNAGCPFYEFRGLAWPKWVALGVHYQCAFPQPSFEALNSWLISTQGVCTIAIALLGFVILPGYVSLTLTSIDLN